MISITIDDHQWFTIYGLDDRTGAAALCDLGVDSVILRATPAPRGSSIRTEGIEDRRWIDALQRSGLRVFVAIDLFDDQTVLERFPDARPVNALGEESWAEPLTGALCPTHEGVLAALADHTARLLDDLNPDGVMLRSAHFPAYWPGWTTNPDYVFSGEDQWCFCERCRAEFAADAGIVLAGISAGSDAAGILALHQQPWQIWRARRLTLAIDGVLKQSGARSKGIEAMLATLPFASSDFGGIDVRRTIGGQDLAMLSGSIDSFALMTDLQLLNRKPSWLGGVVREAVRHLPGSRSVLCFLRIGPHVQRRSNPKQVEIGDLAVNADAIRHSGADGIVISSWTNVLADAATGGARTQLIRDIAASWS